MDHLRAEFGHCRPKLSRISRRDRRRGGPLFGRPRQISASFGMESARNLADFGQVWRPASANQFGQFRLDSSGIEQNGLELTNLGRMSAELIRPRLHLGPTSAELGPSLAQIGPTSVDSECHETFRIKSPSLCEHAVLGTILTSIGATSIARRDGLDSRSHDTRASPGVRSLESLGMRDENGG